MSTRIQRVELPHETSIYCPFCGKDVHVIRDDEIDLNPCPHTLFIAHDEGFEYRSKKFNEVMRLPVELDDLSDMGDENYDSITDKSPIPYSIKFASYQPAPSFFGVYVGFDPMPKE